MDRERAAIAIESGFPAPVPARPMEWRGVRIDGRHPVMDDPSIDGSPILSLRDSELGSASAMTDPSPPASDDGFAVDDREVIHENLEGEAVLVHLGTGHYHSLRGAASAIWDLVVEGRSSSAIVGAMQHRFEGDRARIARATLQVLEDLVARGLASPAPAKATDVPPWEGPRTPFEDPSLESFEDMQDLLLLDPIHETGEEGWPKRA
jgi:hypothetical protein